ncbi:MAG: hypothetical protein ACQEQ5_07865 [Thermodesulfobacteriota bacterium]
MGAMFVSGLSISVLSFTEKGFVFRLTLTSSILRLALNYEFNPFSVDFQGIAIFFLCADYFSAGLPLPPLIFSAMI